MVDDIEEFIQLIGFIVISFIVLYMLNNAFGWVDLSSLISKIFNFLKIILLIIVLFVALLLSGTLDKLFGPSKEELQKRKKALKKAESEKAAELKKAESEKAAELKIIKKLLTEHYEHKYRAKIKHLSKDSKIYYVNKKVNESLNSIKKGYSSVEDFIGNHVDRKIRIPIPAKTRRAIYRAYHLCPICRKNDLQEIHHIDGKPANNKLKNLIALCATCHRKNLSKEVYRSKWKSPKNTDGSKYKK